MALFLLFLKDQNSITKLLSNLPMSTKGPSWLYRTMTRTIGTSSLWVTNTNNGNLWHADNTLVNNKFIDLYRILFHFNKFIKFEFINVNVFSRKWNINY